MAIFKFKQFHIVQEKSAAKVGTDGVLIGAWTPVDSKIGRVLDIGSGTGLISLMIAQRTENAIITAVELDEMAAQECALNFENSPWNDRLQIIQCDIENFQTNKKFDLIVSNPPFFEEYSFAPDSRRHAARNTQSLSFELLLKKADEFLTDDGIFAMIIPYKSKEKFISTAAQYRLYPNNILQVKGNLNVDYKRCLIAFERKSNELKISDLVIEKERHQYTEAYRCLTKDFYLKM